jgi:hypothetical protein
VLSDSGQERDGLAVAASHPDPDPYPRVLTRGYSGRLVRLYRLVQRLTIDQIFPHELLHIIVHNLAGPPPDGNSNQIHAIGVKTDRGTAFSEGFAEHAQIMAIDRRRRSSLPWAGCWSHRFWPSSRSSCCSGCRLRWSGTGAHNRCARRPWWWAPGSLRRFQRSWH